MKPVKDWVKLPKPGVFKETLTSDEKRYARGLVYTMAARACVDIDHPSVVFMPGRKPEEEYGVIRCAFQSPSVTAVDMDFAAVKRARAIGIETVHHGDFEHQTRDRRFDVVSIDINGTCNRTYLELCKQMARRCNRSMIAFCSYGHDQEVKNESRSAVKMALSLDSGDRRARWKNIHDCMVAGVERHGIVVTLADRMWHLAREVEAASKLIFTGMMVCYKGKGNGCPMAGLVFGRTYGLVTVTKCDGGREKVLEMARAWMENGVDALAVADACGIGTVELAGMLGASVGRVAALRAAETKRRAARARVNEDA